MLWIDNLVPRVYSRMTQPPVKERSLFRTVLQPRRARKQLADAGRWMMVSIRISFRKAAEHLLETPHGSQMRLKAPVCANCRGRPSKPCLGLRQMKCSRRPTQLLDPTTNA